MDLTVADMMVGERLFLGTYGVGESSQPIAWLKATRNSDFLAEHVLDYIYFDGREAHHDDYYLRNYGNSNYNQSNIFQFLNSEDDDWFEPAHQYDEAPGTANHSRTAAGMYRNHPGFLSGFEGYEIESLKSKVHLPIVADIVGGRRFELFNRKGIRAHGTQDMVIYRNGHDFTETSWIDYWTQSSYNQYAAHIIGRDGYSKNKTATQSCGLRPKCRVNPNAKIVALPDGSGYQLVAFEANHCKNEACTLDELKAFIGLL